MPDGFTAVVELTRVDSQQRFACQFGLFPAQPPLAPVAQETATEWRTLITSRFELIGAPTTQPLAMAGLPENLTRMTRARLGDMQNLVVGVAVIRFPGRYLGARGSRGRSQGRTRAGRISWRCRGRFG